MSLIQTSVLANDLATVYDEKGRYNKAIRLAEKAIRIASETSPENLATYKYNLGHILLHKGKLIEFYFYKIFSLEKNFFSIERHSISNLIRLILNR